MRISLDLTSAQQVRHIGTVDGKNHDQAVGLAHDARQLLDVPPDVCFPGAGDEAVEAPLINNHVGAALRRDRVQCKRIAPREPETRVLMLGCCGAAKLWASEGV